MNSTIQPDVSTIIDDLASQIAVLTRDLAIARATIVAHEKAADTETSTVAIAPSDTA